MALSAAEKQRRYRANRDADPQRRNEYLQKEKKKYREDLKVGKKKSAKDMTDRQLRSERKRWRCYKRSQKKRQKELEKQLTPPQSPQGNEAQEHIIPNLPQPQPKPAKMKRAYRTKLNRKVEHLEKLIKEEKKRTAMYRKRYQRSLETKTTPRSKANKLLKYLKPNSKKVVRKTLQFHYSLIDQMKANYKKNAKSTSRIVSGHIIQKYKFKYRVRKDLGMFTGTRLRKRIGCISSREWKAVRQFYERDDVSQIVAGKKCTITKSKMKRQKRILKDYMANLHKKYMADNNSSISFTTFYRLKPFWIVSPSEKERETCLCKICENFRLTTETLQRQHIIPEGTIHEILKHVVCDVATMECMYAICDNCNGRGFEIDPTKQHLNVNWKYWTTGQKVFRQDGKEKTVTFPVLENRQGTVSELTDCIQQQLARYKKHSVNISKQYEHYKQLRNKMKENEVMIHSDFSQNYNAKLPNEIQSMHFGAAKPQITLHTGMYYIGNEDSGHPFTTVSDSLNHSPSGIWAHLNPVLKDIKQTHPNVDVIHFFSDGPVTQYKQKGNFFLFTSEIYKYGFKLGTWNFHESGHGKGAPDVIGGAVKRCADKAVSFGKSIMNAADLVDAIKPDTHVSLYIIPEESMHPYEEKLKRKLLPVPGTMQIHQIISTSENKLTYRNISCMCTADKCCPSHAMKSFAFKTLSCSEPSVDSVLHVNTINEPSDDSALHVNTINEPSDDSALHVNTINESSDDSALHVNSSTAVDDFSDNYETGLSLLGKHVAVRYNGMVYPGFVNDVSENDVFVSCMHKVGTAKKNKNCYYWPRATKDECWYELQNVVSIIPPPVPVEASNNFTIDQQTWSRIFAKQINLQRQQ